MELTQKQKEYLSFLQEQLEVRNKDAWTKSRNGVRYAKNERVVTEWSILNMCWNEYLRIHLELYPSFNTKEFKSIWKQIKRYRISKEIPNTQSIFS